MVYAILAFGSQIVFGLSSYFKLLYRVCLNFSFPLYLNHRLNFALALTLVQISCFSGNGSFLPCFNSCLFSVNINDICSKVQDTVSASGSKTMKKIGEPKKSSSQSSIVPSSNYEEDFDDFDPRGTSSASKYLL